MKSAAVVSERAITPAPSRWQHLRVASCVVIVPHCSIFLLLVLIVGSPDCHIDGHVDIIVTPVNKEHDVPSAFIWHKGQFTLSNVLVPLVFHEVMAIEPSSDSSWSADGGINVVVRRNRNAQLLAFLDLKFVGVAVALSEQPGVNRGIKWLFRFIVLLILIATRRTGADRLPAFLIDSDFGRGKAPPKTFIARDTAMIVEAHDRKIRRIIIGFVTIDVMELNVFALFADATRVLVGG